MMPPIMGCVTAAEECSEFSKHRELNKNPSGRKV